LPPPLRYDAGNQGKGGLALDETLRQKLGQRDFHDRIKDGLEDAVERPRGKGPVFGLLNAVQMEEAATLLQKSLEGCDLLNVCCGAGLEAEQGAGFGWKITGVDISLEMLRGAAERAKRYRFPLDLVCGDAENLPFADGSFDLAFTRDGLHHLPDPELGIREMARVSRRGILLFEPRAGLVRRLAVRLGISSEWEESGNRIHELRERDLEPLLGRLGFRTVLFRRHLFTAAYEAPRWSRWFDGPLAFAGFRTLFDLVQRLGGHAWGNKLTVLALR
jgi:SAM-dependent methyltransferase